MPIRGWGSDSVTRGDHTTLRKEAFVTAGHRPLLSASLPTTAAWGTHTPACKILTAAGEGTSLMLRKLWASEPVLTHGKAAHVLSTQLKKCDPDQQTPPATDHFPTLCPSFLRFNHLVIILNCDYPIFKHWGGRKQIVYSWNSRNTCKENRWWFVAVFSYFIAKFNPFPKILKDAPCPSKIYFGNAIDILC